MSDTERHERTGSLKEQVEALRVFIGDRSEAAFFKAMSTIPDPMRNIPSVSKAEVLKLIDQHEAADRAKMKELAERLKGARLTNKSTGYYTYYAPTIDKALADLEAVSEP